MENIKAPGLKWRKLASGLSPVWVADEADVRNGYRPKTMSLRDVADQPDLLIARCNSLQADMLLWRSGYRRDPLAYDGTIRAVLEIYQCHPRSKYKTLKPGSLVPYNHYLGKLRGHIGAMRVDDVSGVDLLDWHDVWSEDGRHIAASATARAVLQAALRFGVQTRLPGCAELLAVIRETSADIPSPRPRTISAPANQVVALRRAAHAKGRPSSALAYALVFETTLRLWDTIGQWYPMDWPDMSTVIDPASNMKWFGLRWEHVNADLQLEFQPSKTEQSTGVRVTYPLNKAPMVLEELAHWPVEKRHGPIIVSEETGLPWRYDLFRQRFSVDRKTAGVTSKLWARDLRASGITEGRASGVALDDVSKVAGHASTSTTRGYDRAVVEASDRFAEGRIKGRERNGNGNGNAR